MKIRVMIITMLVMLLLTGSVLAAKPIISADRTYFDVTTGLYVLNGNVHVEVGNRVIKAKQARVSIATLEVWAAGGVTLKQDDINFSGDSVYVFGRQDRVQIAGGVHFSRTGLTIAADNVDFNWDTKLAVFSGNVKVEQGDKTWTSDIVNYHVVNNTIL